LATVTFPIVIFSEEMLSWSLFACCKMKC